MQRALLSIFATLAALAPWTARASDIAAGDLPRYNAANELIRPGNYREWVWLSSGLGMTYSSGEPDAANPAFDNVFVAPSAYRAFLATGKWPDQTMFILEVRSSASRGSINQGGHFQTDLVGIQAEVKDESRFPQKWAFFPFGGGASPRAASKPFPANSACQSCHGKNAAVENTFVQFYPTLLEVARAKGTLKASYRPPAATPGQFLAAVMAEGWEKAQGLLADAKAQDPHAALFDEESLNRAGYELMSAHKTGDAVEVLRYAAELYPGSANAADSLSEACEADGRKRDAVKAARRALELLPSAGLDGAHKQGIEASAKKRIERLNGDSAGGN